MIWRYPHELRRAFSLSSWESPWSMECRDKSNSDLRDDYNDRHQNGQYAKVEADLLRFLFFFFFFFCGGVFGVFFVFFVFFFLCGFLFFCLLFFWGFFFFFFFLFGGEGGLFFAEGRHGARPQSLNAPDCARRPSASRLRPGLESNHVLSLPSGVAFELTFEPGLLKAVRTDCSSSRFPPGRSDGQH